MIVPTGRQAAVLACLHPVIGSHVAGIDSVANVSIFSCVSGVLINCTVCLPRALPHPLSKQWVLRLCLMGCSPGADVEGVPYGAVSRVWVPGKIVRMGSF